MELNEQMKAIQKELGEMEDVPNEIEELANKNKMQALDEMLKINVYQNLKS